MTRIVHHDRIDYVVADDDPMPHDARWWAVLRTRAVDEVTGSPPRNRITLSTTTLGCQTARRRRRPVRPCRAPARRVRSHARTRAIDRAEVYTDWKARAREQGIDFREVTAKQSAPRERYAKPAREAVAWTIARPTERESVISHRDIVRHALEYGTGRATLAEVTAGIRDAKKRRVLLRVNDSRYTTTKAIMAESETLAGMRRGQGRVRPIASMNAAQEAARERQLACDQTDAATFILTAKDRVIGVQGYAGTGKTHMLRVVCEVAERAGFSARGFAPSATAARVLQQDSGIPSDSIDAARSEERAVECGQRNPPELILLNLDALPNDVIATARRIRTPARLDPRVPIVLFCAECVAEGEEVDLGDNVYATQPDHFNQLRDFLAGLLQS